MRPKAQKRDQEELFRVRLERLVAPGHELVRLSRLIEWSRFDEKFGALFVSGHGRPATPTRLMVGLHYLKYTYDLSDEEVVARWVENPYWQYFCGEGYFCNELPIDPSSMTRWRRRVGAEGSRELLQETLAVAVSTKTMKLTELESLCADTTVQEKNVTFPTDAKLLNRARVRLALLAKESGVPLRQSYTHLGRKALIAYHRYMAAKHFKRARRRLKKLRTYLGRIVRDIGRKIAGNEALTARFKELLEVSQKLLSEQRQKRGRTVFSIHAPEVECIAKGKAHKPYEFGVKVSVIVTSKSGFVVGCDAHPGRPHDAKTLRAALLDVEENLGRRIRGAEVAVDLGYRGHGCRRSWTVLHPKLKRLSRRQRKLIRRRSAIEAVISHLKNDCRMGRNFLKGTIGDRMNAIFAAAAYNLRLLLTAVVYLLLKFLNLLTPQSAIRCA
jgi:IS5 family transposase